MGPPYLAERPGLMFSARVRDEPGNRTLGRHPLGFGRHLFAQAAVFMVPGIGTDAEAAGIVSPAMGYRRHDGFVAPSISLSLRMGGPILQHPSRIQPRLRVSCRQHPRCMFRCVRSRRRRIGFS
jgi:hypothetical protein